METSDHAVTDQADQPNPILKCCPFCAGKAEVVTANEPTRHGVRCASCHAGFQPVFKDREEAFFVWNWRGGTSSAAGGRATKGISTAKKRRTCRRNLKLARKAKKLKKVWADVDAAYAQLKPLRAAQIAEAEAAAAKSRAWLKAREAEILADPLLRRVYDLLPSRRRALAGSEAVDDQT